MELQFASFLVFFFIANSSAQLRCTYVTENLYLNPEFKMNIYGCKLYYVNLNNTQFDMIEGTHLANKSDADVKFVKTTQGRATDADRFEATKIEPLFCSKFPNLELFILHMTTKNLSFKMNDWNAETFNNCANLERLEVTQMRMTKLVDEAFVKIPQLKILKIDSQSVSEISANAFRGFNSLEYLTLYSTRLSEINPEWFKSLTNLKELSLNSNPVDDIPENAFETLENLESLDLSYHYIENLKPGWFSPLKMLKVLILFNNRLQELSKGIFEQNTKLEILFLTYNEISTIDADAFGRETLNSLRILRITANPVEAVDFMLLEDTPKLESFELNGNCAFGNYQGIKSENYAQEREELRICYEKYDAIIGRTTTTTSTTTEPETTTTAPSTEIISDGQAYISLPLNGAYRVEILVKAARNAFVSFSNIENDSFPPIEIRIGAVTNTKTQIYENLMKNVEVLTPAILSEIEFRKFIVEISDGEVLVFQGDEATPIASMAITSAFELNFVGVKSQFVTSSWIVSIVE